MNRVPDVLAPGVVVIFCGSALGDVSWKRRAYYANPGNRFWQTLAETGITPRQLKPEEYAVVASFGIGLTDLVKTDHGQDEHIFDGHVDMASARTRLTRTIARWQPSVLAFTSKTAAKHYLGHSVRCGRQLETIGSTAVWVLPSTSGLARRFFDISVWKELAAYLQMHSVCSPLVRQDRTSEGE